MTDAKIVKQNVEDIMGLTSTQEGMLFHYLANPYSKQYFQQISLCLAGKMDITLFKQAWYALAQTNEMLRSVIRWEKLEEPVQVILKKKEIHIRVKDLQDKIQEQQELSDNILREDREQPIDLTGAPLRITLCLLDEDKSKMILTFHHIIYDGWSCGIILKELLEAYNRLLRGEEPELPGKSKYKEFIKWYQQYRQQDKHKQDEFWKRYLEAFDTRTLLPYNDNKVGDIAQVRTYRTTVSPVLQERVDRCVQGYNVTISTFLYAAWGLLLQKYNKSDDIIFGTTVSGRTPVVKGIEKIVGLFINTLPLRLKAVKDDTVMEVLHSIGSHLGLRNEHEHSSLISIKQLSGIGKESDLFDSIVVIDNYPLDNLLTRPDKDNASTSHGLVICSYDKFEMTNFDITLQIMMLAAGHMQVDFHYNRDLFDPGTVQRMAHHYINLLSGITGSEPDTPISHLRMLSDQEVRQVLQEFNDPSIDYVVEKTIPAVLEDRVMQVPANQAVRYGDQWLTYRQLNEQVSQLALGLGEFGVKAGTGSRVAVMFPRSIEMIVAVLGILKAGAACIPLDISYPEERNTFIVRDSEAGFFLAPVPGIIDAGKIPGVTEIIYDREQLNKINIPAGNPGQHVNPGDLSYIIYTSGSTGQPKGALLHHSGVVNHTYTKIDVLGISHQDTVANNFSINVIASVWQILSPLFTGARLTVYSEEIEWDPYRQFEQVETDGVTVIEVIPSVLKAYLFVLDEGKEKIKLEHLRKIALTTEETKPFLVNKFYEKYTHIDLVDCYGQTECCDDVLHYTIPHDTNTQKVPIGTPSLNTNVFILNHHDQLQPVGVVGEICAAGAGVAYGYWKRPELTTEKFNRDLKDYGDYRDGYHRSDRSHKSYTLYRTGDLGRWLPDGKVEFLGRIDHQVKIRGNRVELREIENHMLRFPAVKEAAVVAREDREGEKNLYAFFISNEDITSTDIRRFLLNTLPDYMIPAHFVSMEKLPLTPNGKIDRKALVKAEIKTNIATGIEYQPPRNEIEGKIREIWSELLEGKEKEQIGIDDNFFDLGGHSLLLIKLKSKLAKKFHLQQEIGIIELFNFPTIAAQAQYMEKKVEVKVEEQGVNRKKTQKNTIEIPGEKGKGTGKEIAVIGISLQVPGSSGIEGFWWNLINGIESISFFREDELEGSEVDSYVRGSSRLVAVGGVIGGIEYFDADFFGFNPREAEIIEPQQRLFLQYAWEALEDAGYGAVGDTFAGAVGVYAGVGLNTYLLNNVMAHPGLVSTLGEFQTMIGNDKDFLATRTAYKLNLKGPAITLQTACSTSLVAIHLARQGLLDRDCDMAVVGGAAVHVPEKSGYFYNEGGYLSPDGHCRPFDAEANGTVFGSGIGVVVLKRLAEALEDRDHIYAVIKGSAINNDGSLKVGYTSPGEIGQANVILRALREADVNPGSIGYIETHGTGTVLGDPVEMAALKRAFKEAAGNIPIKNQYCAVGSVKSNIGHLDIAAGVIGFIKAVLCLYHGRIPPGINVSELNPMIDFPNTPFYVSRQAIDWPLQENRTPRRAGVSSFGIGGTNAHVILEEAAAGLPNKEGTSAPMFNGESSSKHQLILLSAKTETALKQTSRNLVFHLKQCPGISLADAAYTLTVGRKAFAHRLALVCLDKADAVAALESFDPKRILMHSGTPGEKSVVFMFPGVGEHYVNMAYDLYRQEPVFREEVDRCCDILEPILEKDLRDILFVEKLEKTGKTNEKETINLRKLLNGEKHAELEEEKVLSQTIYSQAAVFVVGYALARLLFDWGIRPYAMIGYSIGEYIAACLSGVFSLSEALFLVARRARLIHDLEQGAMLAISLPEKEITPLLTEGVSIAAVNTPDLCIVSGQLAGIEALEHELGKRKIVFRRLKTFQAFHSPMMAAIEKELTAVFDKVTFHPPNIPYISNVTGTWVTAEQVTDPGYWITHTVSPIRFSRGIGQLLNTSGHFFLEVGPGNSLCGFAAQHHDAKNKSVPDRLVLGSLPKESENIPARFFLLRSLSKLWAAGLEIDWHSFYKHQARDRKRVPLPKYPFEGKRYWLEPGAGQTKPAIDTREAAGKNVRIPKKENMADWFYLPYWKQSLPALASAGPSPNKTRESDDLWLFFFDESGTSPLFIHQLKTYMKLEPQQVVLVKPGPRFEKLSQGNERHEMLYMVNPGQYLDYIALLQALQDQGAGIGKILHLWLWPTLEKEIKATDNADKAEGPGETGPYLERGVYSLLYLVKAMGKLSIFNPLELWVVSTGMHRVESSDTGNPGKAAVLGPCKVIPQEYSHIVCRSIDFAEETAAAYDPQQMVQQMAIELKSPGMDPVIAFRGINRWVRAFEPLKLEKRPEVPLVLREKGVYLVTGGLGNIGMSLARFLAESVHARLVLISRTGLSHHRSEKVKQLEEIGAEVTVVQADAANRRRMQQAMEQVEKQLGTLHGVVHAAGIMEENAFKLIADSDRQDCELHFKPKIQGLMVLEELLRDKELDFCILTSSLSPILGGLSLNAYSAANSFMDAFAHQQSLEKGKPWLSINWADWHKEEPTGDSCARLVSASTVSHLNITPQEGRETFKRALSLFRQGIKMAGLVISSGDLHRRRQQWVLSRADAEPGEGSPQSTSQKSMAYQRPLLQSIYEKPKNEAEKVVVEIWQTLLGIEMVGVHDNFFELGGHSLIATKLISRLREIFRIDIPLPTLFDRPTIREVVENIVQTWGDAGTVEEIARIYREVQAL